MHVKDGRFEHDRNCIQGLAELNNMGLGCGRNPNLVSRLSNQNFGFLVMIRKILSLNSGAVLS